MNKYVILRKQGYVGYIYADFIYRDSNLLNKRVEFFIGSKCISVLWIDDDMDVMTDEKYRTTFIG